MQTQQGFCGRKGPAIGFSQEQFFVLEQREREKLALSQCQLFNSSILGSYF